MHQHSEAVAGRVENLAIWLQRRVLWFSRHWLASANLFLGVMVGLPWLAPILLKLGATGPARGIYLFYSILCHQLADRSFFLFGPKVMYASTELLITTPDADTWLGLRAFTGTAELGFKVAWSDRMVSLYGGILLGGLIFALLRQWLKPPRWRIFLLLVVPIIADGVTHWISDLDGLGQGFRYSNVWLVTLTGNVFSESFYVGNALGSFNSWMRLITGLLCGLGLVWLVYPLIEASLRDVHQMQQPRTRAPQTVTHVT